jgi:type II secretory pathway pseudopilin PulG
VATAAKPGDTADTPSPSPAPSPAPPQDADRAAGLVRGRWDALVVFLILGSLALVFYIAVTTYRASTTDTAAVLGTVIPAIGTVGAAAFGVATGVRAGQQAGAQQADEARRRADEQQEAARRQQQALLRLVPTSTKLAEQIAALTQVLYKASESPSGKGTMTIGPPGPRPLSPDDPRVQHIDPVILDEMQIAAAQIADGLDRALNR